MRTLEPSEVVRFEASRDGFSAIILASGPDDEGVFVHDPGPDGFWVRRVPVVCEVAG